MSEFDITKEVRFDYTDNPDSSSSQDSNKENEIHDEDTIPEDNVLHSAGPSDEADYYGNSETEQTAEMESDERDSVPVYDDGISNESDVTVAFEKSKETEINETEPSVKKAPTEKNEGYFFDRQKVFIIVGVISIVTIFFLVFILPVLSKDKVKKESKMKQASKSWSAIDEWVEPVKEDEPVIDTTPQNSSENIEEDEEIPPVQADELTIEDDNISSSSKPKRPVTNSNEQQKSIYRLSLDDDRNNRSNSYQNGQRNGNSGSNYSSYDQFSGGNSYAYTPPALNDNIGRYMASLNGDSFDRQNNQSGKEQFFNRGGQGGNYNWNSEYTLWKGTIIPAVLETAINSDLPGVVIATVTTNIYSSLDGKHLLIPQGSKLYAEYSSSISYGQNRVQVVWNTLIRPDGLEVNLGGLNGVDATGVSGYSGVRTGHPFEFLKAMGLIACFSLLDTKMDRTIANSSNMYTQNMLDSTYSETKKLNNKIVDRALDIQPTIRISSGRKVDLITNVSMELPPLEPYPVQKKYKRN